MPTVTNDAHITAAEIYELLKKVAIEYAEMPIYLILDNARYQKCKIVEDLAGQLGIHLTYYRHTALISTSLSGYGNIQKANCAQNTSVSLMNFKNE